MRFPGFIGPSYTQQSKNSDAQRCINLYAEVNEIGSGKEREVATLIGTPGQRLLVTLAGGTTRGGYTASNGELFVAAGNKLYGITSAWAAVELGTLSTSEGFVSFADNGTHVILVDGTYGYTCTVAGASFAQIVDADFLAADQVTFQDGYFILNKSGSGQFFISGLNAITFDALDIATAEGLPDNLVGLISDHQNLFLFGAKSAEVHYNSGAADFPFARNQGAILEVGCAAAFSIAKLPGSIYWLGQDDTGKGIVYRATGFQPQRISTHALEKVIAGLGTLSTARAWVYQQNGHAFYCLNLPGAETTWVFDTSTSLWHERASFLFGAFSRHKADWHAFAHSTNVVGDFESGKIYALDPEYYSDNGAEIVRERAAPHISKELRRVFHTSFQLDMETGVGLDGTGQGIAPQAILQWSDDGGNSWSSELFADIGAIGSRATRVIWRRLGSARDRVYRVRISDPIKVTLLGADLLMEEGAS